MLDVVSVLALGASLDAIAQGTRAPRVPEVAIVGDQEARHLAPRLADVVRAAGGKVEGTRTATGAHLAALAALARAEPGEGPDVLIVIGGNNGTPPRAVAASMRQIRKRAGDPRRIVYVGPMPTRWGPINQARRATSAAMQEAAGPRDVVIDSFDAVPNQADPATWQAGGLGLTPAGYDLAAQRMAPAVVAAVSPLVASICDWTP